MASRGDKCLTIKSFYYIVHLKQRFIVKLTYIMVDAMQTSQKVIVITAGGTIEPIDGVRGITNFSRGRLGHQLAERLAQRHVVFYVRSRTAPAPASPGMRWEHLRAESQAPAAWAPGVVDVPTTDTASVWAVIQAIHALTPVDAFIHAMAVSDYTVERVVDLDTLIENVRALAEAHQLTPDAVASLMRNPPALAANGKVSSDLKHPLLYLEQTEKILPKIKMLWPHATLVGFKLLNGVSTDELLAVARAAMNKVNGDYVVANDLTQIQGEAHTAHVLNKNTQTILSVGTKTDLVATLERIIES